MLILDVFGKNCSFYAVHILVQWKGTACNAYFTYFEYRKALFSRQNKWAAFVFETFSNSVKICEIQWEKSSLKFRNRINRKTTLVDTLGLLCIWMHKKVPKSKNAKNTFVVPIWTKTIPFSMLHIKCGNACYLAMSCQTRP